MSAFGLEGFAAVEAVDVEVELYTSAYRVTGTVHTRFRRVAEILNQLPGGFLTVERVTFVEHGAPGARTSATSALVAVDQILLIVASGLAGEARSDMRIEKQPAHAILAMPPLRLEGTIHVPVGSNPVDGLVNVPDRFLPMTDAHLTSGTYPDLDRDLPILALRRDRSHVMVVREQAEADADPDGSVPTEATEATEAS